MPHLHCSIYPSGKNISSFNCSFFFNKLTICYLYSKKQRGEGNMNKYVVNEKLIADINKGNEKSFSLLYDCYYVFLCTHAVTYILDPDKAEEIVNDVFIRMWDNRKSLTFPIHFYLVQSVRNACLNYLQKLQLQRYAMDEYRQQLWDIHKTWCMTDNDPLTLLEFKELQSQVRTAVNTLPEKCKKVFEHYLYQGKSYQQIAEEMNININTVRVQIKNALDRLKLVLGPNIRYLLVFLIAW